MDTVQDGLSLYINDDCTIKMKIQEKGLTRIKYIDPDNFLDCVRNSVRQDIQIFSGLLPENTLSITIGCNTNVKYIVLDYKDGWSDITYMNTTYPHFPLPRLVFGVTVEDSGRISSVNLGVPANEKKLTEKTPMYYYPFSNVDGFSLCVGINTMPNIKTLQSLQNFPDFILSLPDNNDWYKRNNNKLKLEHRDLMEHLNDKDTGYYYDHILVPMPGTCLKHFLKKENT